MRKGLLGEHVQNTTVSMVKRTQDLEQLGRPGPASQKALTGVFSVDLYSTVSRTQISVQGLTKERSMWFSFQDQHQLNDKCPWKGGDGNCLLAGLVCKHWNAAAGGLVRTSVLHAPFFFFFFWNVFWQLCSRACVQL